MPRERFEDDDDRDDRKSRRGKGSGGGNTVGIVLGVLGGLFLLTLLGCGGCVYYVFTKGKEAFTDAIDTNVTANAFVDNLKDNQIDVAYNTTSKGYQSRVSREQFNQLLKKQPLLTTHKQSRLGRTNLPAENKKKEATFSFTLLERIESFGNDIGDDDSDDDGDDENPGNKKPKPATKTPPKKDTTPNKSIVINLTLIKENGKWVVDEFIVP
jgi:hypothetical protein